jgi:hypothetical protein
MKSPFLGDIRAEAGMMEELRKLLTPAERCYLEWRLPPAIEGGPPPLLSLSYARKLEQHIRGKIHRLLRAD